MSAPNGQSASFAILNDWMPNGMPMIVMQFSRPAPTYLSAIQKPTSTTQMMLASVEPTPPP